MGRAATRSVHSHRPSIGFFCDRGSDSVPRVAVGPVVRRAAHTTRHARATTHETWKHRSRSRELVGLVPFLILKLSSPQSRLSSRQPRPRPRAHDSVVSSRSTEYAYPGWARCTPRQRHRLTVTRFHMSYCCLVPSYFIVPGTSSLVVVGLPTPQAPLLPVQCRTAHFTGPFAALCRSCPLRRPLCSLVSLLCRSFPR